MFRLRISACPSRCCVPSKPPSTPCPRPSRRAPFPRFSRPRRLGVAQTGTGKTAAFALPVLQQLAASKRTRAAQEPACARAGADPRARGPDRRSFDTYGRGLGLRLCPSSAAWATAARSRPWRAASTSWSPRRAACSTWSSAATCKWATSSSSSSTRPTACSTWASSATCAASSSAVPSSARRCCSPRPCRATSPSSARRS